MTQPDVANADAAKFNQSPASGIPATLFTQEQVNHFNAEAKRTAVSNYFKELGLDKPPTGEELSTALQQASEYQKLQNGQKSDVERLTADLATKTAEAEKVPALEAAKRRAELAGDAGLKSRYHKYVEGSTDEEIDASIKLVLADVGGGGGEPDQTDQEQQPPAKKGTGGTPPAPNPQQGLGSGSAPKSTLAAGREAYKAKHGEKE